jgi:hypothetical protein
MCSAARDRLHNEGDRVDNKILLIVVFALFAVAAAFVVFAPGEQDMQAVSRPTAPSQTEGATSTAVVSASQDVQANIATGADQAGESQTASDIASGTTPPSSYRVIATYFHNTARCVTCRSIEQRSRDTIQTAFAAEIASGRLVWRALNMEEKENEHYAINYDLPYASLVLAEVDGEREVRFKVLEQTWDLVHKRQPLLENYVESETRAFLEGR